MTAFQRIVVGMDLTSMDTQLLEHLPLYTGGNPAPKLHFLHVAYAMQLPVMISGRYTRKSQDQPSNQTSLDAMKAEVSPRLNSEHFDVEFHVLEGTITRQLLTYANDHRIDLTVMGRKKHPVGTGVAAHRYLRGSEGSVLFVTENRKPTLDRILITTDFSEYSESVVNRTLELVRQQNTDTEIHFVNVYDVPTDLAYRISRTEGQFAKIIRENVESVIPDFLDKFDLEGINHKFHLIENTRYNAAQHVIEFAENTDMDLLVIGARGHSVVSALLLGSVAERILRYNEEIPLLVMRCEGS